jgi:nucleoid DNA-binding protein
VTKNKISKNQFLADVARNNDMSLEDITDAYNAIVNGIHDVVASGRTLSLTGFGSFYLQRHKGHPVQFEGRSNVEDYVIFKFSASDVLNKRFRQEDADGQIVIPT